MIKVALKISKLKEVRKLPSENDHLHEIVAHRRHLITVVSCLPGENAWGFAEFKEDPKHHLDLPILLGTEIQQALLEIAEVAIRSKTDWQKLKFIGFHCDVKWRQKVPIKGILHLPVFAEKIYDKTRNSDAVRIVGKIRAVLLDANRDKKLTEAIISFELERL
jgi:hypothetical protein